MARIKAEKIQACATRAEFEAAVDAAAKCSVQREKLVAALKARHQAIDDKYGAEIKALDADIKNAHERAAPYFEAHAGELCAPGRRSGSTKLANFGVHQGGPFQEGRVEGARHHLRRHRQAQAVRPQPAGG